MAELETASDDWFVDFDDDGLPDLAVGRLPVRTLDQANAIVAKTLGYETEADAPWLNDVLVRRGRRRRRRRATRTKRRAGSSRRSCPRTTSGTSSSRASSERPA